MASLFSGNNQNVHELIKHGMMLFSVGSIFSGFNIFTSAFFTALSDGLTSAIVSFSRTFLFIIAGLYLMMAILGIDGLWLSIPFAELCAFVISIIFLKVKQKTRQNKKGLRFEVLSACPKTLNFYLKFRVFAFIKQLTL